MGWITKVISSDPAFEENDFVLDVKVDPSGGIPVTAQDFGSTGDDSRPLPGDYAATMGTTGHGESVVVGYVDPNNEGKAAAGEKRIYSRDPLTGEVKAEFWLKSDGSVVCENENGKFELKANGQVDINDGNFTVDP